MNIVLQRHRRLCTTPALWVEARPQFRRQNRTNLITPPERPIANPRDEVIYEVPQPARNNAQHCRQHRPPTTQTPQNMQKSVRPNQQRPVVRQHHNAIWQSRPLLCRNSRFERRSLQGREPKRLAIAIVLQHELHGPMTQPAMSIIKNIFRGQRFSHHQKSIARAKQRPVVPRAAISDRGRHTPARIALRETFPGSPLPLFPKLSKLVLSLFSAGANPSA
jgi:hypothetical protein